MTRDDWAQVKRIVAGALSQSASEQPAYLNTHLGSAPAMLDEARSLLAATLRASHFYEDPALLIDGARITLAALHDLAPTPTFMRETAEALRRTTPETYFEGTERYGVRRQIGLGGMGIVYEVDDRARHQVVALKTLRHWNAADIYRLKQEFRGLADIAHPNLASLYDLVVDDERCFFTMELVRGVTFVAYARPSSGAADIHRVRRVLPALIEGLQELHRRGKLHRDVKPSNVLVTPEGRVVILDFGLTSNIAQDSALERGLAGTPAYLSPEQSQGLETSEASDWYSVGVTLYQALTGRLPFDGALLDIIQRKTTTDPVAASAIAPDIPDDLNDLCMALLCRDPRTRPTGAEALRRLSAATGAVPVAAVEEIRESAFVGRAYYLEALSAAFAAVKEGRSASVYIHGPSGIGKSALVQSFFDRRLTGEPLVALRGKCYEHESVPYKGLDGIVDSLSRYLATVPPTELGRMMPHDVAVLARLFPVMQLDALMTAPAPAFDQPGADPLVVRRRAFAALRELLTTLAARHPLIIEIDDFHWADPDSVAALTELLRPPQAPALLLLISFRSEELESKPFLRALIERVDLGTTITLPLAPMTEDEVGRLITALLPPDTRDDSDQRHAIVREAGGNPYLVEELTRYVALGVGAHRGASLEEMLERRLDSLPPESRTFLETLAVCGRPIRPARIFEACGLDGDERPLVARLRAAHFVRNSRSPDHVEMYHDRIRETLAAEIPRDATRQIHELMAGILVAHGDDDPEALFEHYRAAGHDVLAAGYGASAAAKASAVLAFDRAAALYRHALDLQPHADQRAEWTAGLARSLENAGRPAHAADAYLDAAREANDLQRVEWLRKAAEQLLIGGHIDRGLDIIHQVLPAVGMRLARGPRAALGSILVRRTQLAWRGLDFAAREASQIPQEALLRIDTCWSITTGLAMVDNIRAASFHARQLLIALDTGEPYRIARALALESGFSALAGGKAAIQRSAAFSERARVMAERLHHPHVIALSLVSAGAAAFVLGQWAKGTDLCRQALTILRDDCTGVIWEQTLAQNFFLGCLLFRGELRDVAHRLPDLLQSARDRGNLYFEVELCTRMNLVWLGTDQADEGERQANRTIARWSDSGFHRQHYNHLLARVQTALYRGRAEEAWTLVADHLAPVRRNLWLRVQLFRIETAFMRARCALAMAAAGRDARKMRARAARDASQIARENMPWSNPLAILLRATLAYQNGDEHEAAQRLSDAIEAFSRVDMHLYAAVARRRLAALVGGDRGATLRRDAEDWMAAQEIRNPVAMTRLLIPGFPD